MTPQKRVYLDHNATSPLRPAARAAVVGALDALGNASSVHTEGRQARRIVEDARERVAALAGTGPANVIFTSGATEANNWALSAGWEKLFVAAVEHDSVLAPAARATAGVIKLEPDLNGIVRIDDQIDNLAGVVSCGPGQGQSSCVALQMANNETGVIQPVAEMAAFCREHGIAVHTDAVQAAGRIKIEFQDLGVDMLSLSSHKIGGPMGVGAMILRDGVDLPAFIVGGGQERRWRSGTENIAGIAGFGAAAESALQGLADVEKWRAMRDDLERHVKAITPTAQIIGEGAVRLANTSCIALPGTSAEMLLIKLDLAGIAVSSGAACSSGKVGASHVLSAMGVADEVARGAIRISLGWNSSGADIAAFLDAWRHITRSDRRAVA
ncbi:MAG: cysteine desulfurase family protein [Pseudomonadota bacterium]